MSVLRDILRFLLGVFMPLIVIVAGAGICGLGLTWGSTPVIYAGLFVIGAGVVWGAVSYGGSLDI